MDILINMTDKMLLYSVTSFFSLQLIGPLLGLLLCCVMNEENAMKRLEWILYRLAGLSLFVFASTPMVYIIGLCVVELN